MIEKMRKPSKSKNFLNYIVYVIIFGMIIGSFVLMIPGLGGGGVQSASDAATVGSTTITKRDYLDQVKQLEAQYTQMFNGEFPEFMRERVRQSALQTLVRTEVLSDYANKEGLRVASEEVGYMLKEASVFQEEGEFSRDRYDNYLNYQGKSAAQFEDKLKKQISAQRVNEYFLNGILPAPQEAKLNEEADSMSLEFEYIELSPSAIKNQIKVSDAEAEAVLGTEEGKSAVELFYPRVKSDFKTKDSVEVKQIIVKDQKTADDLRAKLTVENFVALAKENSIDPLAKSNGGDLGAIEKGQFSKEIEDVAFKMEESKISNPIKVTSGFAIIMTGKKKASEDADFESVKSKVAKLYLQSEGAKTLTKDFVALAKAKDFTALSKRASSAGLKWNNPGKFSLSDKSLPGIGDSKEIEDAVFSLKKDGDIYPEALVFQGKEYIVKRLKINTVSTDDKKPQLNQNGRGQSIIQNLFEKHREDLDVNINPSLFES